MNILITSAGRRSSLVTAFKEAAHRRKGLLYAGDIDSLAPALFLADQALPLPAVQSPEYIPRLLALAAEHSIRLIVPTIDTELPVLARASDGFSRQGCPILVSPPELVNICGDKWQFVKVFDAHGIKVPHSWLPGEADSDTLPDRLFIKPRNGSASLNAYRVHRNQLEQLLPLVPYPIIQEEITAPEITIDALLDLEGRPVHYVPRRRLRTIGGESIQGVTISDAGIKGWILRVLSLVSSMGGKGPLAIQAFLTQGEPTLSEINPRFGGGFPLAKAAGGDYPEWIMMMLEGKTVAERIGDYKPNLYMTRYYTELFLEEPLWQSRG
ncbi:MAG: ATP-grasp domain-containing protein [Bacteroidota bacterium]